ncbi:peptide ABC transporter permease [Sphaerisporangium krabiense]|uniref:Peptide/nickel transport system permease protein n=1 Tax=Sphaerisporangium krabiense TaxID=763782 RepID=A0A7W9DQL1_9ACTN|nr:ABC transporter permease [Sphaerisporangium krabiense]MBB5627591.1 peptide/nickel transport system permease protein [Sphaerisporangium krabiense]GII66605.1 peptide ABC transporter permease [Sphaerisporangium krabiense]
MSVHDSERVPRVVAAAEELPGGRPKSMWRLGLEAFLENRLAVAGLVILVAALLFCFLGPLIYRTNQINTDLAAVNLSPGTPGHPLGTDQAGYDQLGRLMAGGQVSLTIGFAAAAISTVIGTLWGAVAGFFGGLVDTVMMRVVDALLAIPALFLLLVLVTIVKPSMGMMIFVFGLTAWLITSRLVRGESLSLRVREYVQAVRVMGGTSWRAVLRHIMPNVAGTVIVNATFQVADAILVVAYLGFLGLGISPPATDWGGMLNNGVNFIYTNDWWLIYPPGLAIIFVVVAVNFIGDGVRDAVEVRLRRR